VLFVGSIFNRRHVPELIQAFSLVAARHDDAFLHLVGDNRSHPHQDVPELIASSPVRARIHWHRYASDAELRELYGSARAFAFLSEYEGLGLTPLEALSAGVPSLLLDTAVARESCGSAALYVADADVERIASGLERLLYDEPLRRELLGGADAALSRYDWSLAARQTMKVLEDAR
jgi:glycosyltransferase involved in cell wall biosynthesis